MIEYDNLAKFFPEEDRKKLGVATIETFLRDTSSRSKRLRRWREIYSLFGLEPKPKSFPFQNSANIRLPLLTSAVLQHHARLYDMLVPGGGKVADVVSPKLGDAAADKIAERYFNYYITHEMPEFDPGMDSSLMQLTLIGDAFRTQGWDRALGRACSKWLPVEDFVCPAKQKSRDPGLRDLPRYAIVERANKWKLKRDGELYEWLEYESLNPHDIEEEEELEGEKSDRLEEDTEKTAETNRIIVKMFQRLELPKKPKKNLALDGKDHWVQITVDKSTQKLLSVVLAEEEDPRDFRRFMAAQQAFDSDMQTYENARLSADSSMVKATEEVGEPKPPEPQRRRPISFITRYSGIPTDGFYSQGLGDLLLGLNKALNTITNQSLDGETVRISRPGYISKQLRGPRGSIDAHPGKLVEIDAPMGSLRDGFYFPDLPQSSPLVGNIVTTIRDMSTAITGAADTMSGEIPGSNQAAQSVLALIEQAQMPITVMAKRVRKSFRNELANLWRILGVHLPESSLVDIIEGDNIEAVEVKSDMFRPDAQVYPVGDQRTKSERVRDATNTLQQVMGNPFIGANPSPESFEILKFATAQLFRALGEEKIVSLIEKIPAPQAVQPGQVPPGATQEQPQGPQQAPVTEGAPPPEMQEGPPPEAMAQ